MIATQPLKVCTNSRSMNMGMAMNFISDPKVFFVNDMMKWDFSWGGMIFIICVDYLFPFFLKLPVAKL
jgi:hypothetical protein